MMSARCQTGASLRGLPVGWESSSSFEAPPSGEPSAPERWLRGCSSRSERSSPSACWLSGLSSPSSATKPPTGRARRLYVVHLFEQHRPHADGKLVDLHSTEFGHRKVAEFMDGDHRTEHKHRSQKGNDKRHSFSKNLYSTPDMLTGGCARRRGPSCRTHTRRPACSCRRSCRCPRRLPPSGRCRGNRSCLRGRA